MPEATPEALPTGPSPSPSAADASLAAELHGTGALREDPAVSAAARRLAARVVRSGRAADATGALAVRWAFQAEGVFDAAPLPVAVVGTGRAIVFARVVERARQELASRDQPPDRFGIGVLDAGDRTVAVLLLVRRRATLTALPSGASAGGKLLLSGALLPPLSAPEVVVTPPGQRPLRLPSAAASPAFSSTVTLATKGRWLLEVLGRGPRGPEVAVLLPLEVGAPLLEPPLEQPADEEADGGPAKERIFAAKVDELRLAHGLPLLTIDEALGHVARAYAVELARTGRFAHVSPESGALADRLGRAGYRYLRAGENLALAPTAAGAFAGTTESPGHLANLLDGAFTRVGYGAAKGKTAGGVPTWIVVQLFAAPP